jgi:WhiB family redox-sensing transcriptional regulator
MSIFDIRPDRWSEDAACIGVNPELFFPIEGTGPRRVNHVRGGAAKAICETCTVREICLTKALEEEAERGAERWGIRGGLDETERAALVEGGAA